MTRAVIIVIISAARGRRPPTTIGLLVTENWRDCPFVWCQNICIVSYSFVTIHTSPDGRTDIIATAIACVALHALARWKCMPKICGSLPRVRKSRRRGVLVPPEFGVEDANANPQIYHFVMFQDFKDQIVCITFTIIKEGMRSGFAASPNHTPFLQGRTGFQCCCAQRTNFCITPGYLDSR